jgi:hypothetical protein
LNRPIQAKCDAPRQRFEGSGGTYEHVRGQTASCHSIEAHGGRIFPAARANRVNREEQRSGRNSQTVMQETEILNGIICMQFSPVFSVYANAISDHFILSESL